jgi:pyruvate dehydrogenase E2 component (dihydrolipoamide acetyltransferase)
MAIDITVPRLGWNMDEGTFVAWLKADGEHVKAGEPLYSLETDKAVQEVESLDSGTLHILPSGPQPGETVAVGTVIGRLVEGGENGDDQRVSTHSHLAASAEAALRPAVDLTPSTERQAASRSSSRDVRASPRARRKAQELGLDWTKLEGSGAGGRVRERDVIAASTLAAACDQTARVLREEESEAVAISGIRRATAQRMLASVRGTAPVTLMSTIDATNLVNLRQQFKTVAQAGNEHGPSGSIGYTDIVIKLAALALERHPALNSRWEDDRIVMLKSIHIGLAIDTEAGLLVPVIRDVPSLTLRQVAARSQDLIARARQRRLKPDELHGGTFTVTNLGPFGVDAFTPIINPPECAVLGIGRITKVPALIDQQFTQRDRMTLCLTFDHRIIDGAPAARFLQDLASLLENPSPWLLP